MSTLQDIKEGDEIVFDSGSNYGFSLSIEKITRVTDTQIKIKTEFYELKFDRTTGRKIGDRDTWTFPKIMPATQELRDKIEHNRLTFILAKIEWSKMSLDKLRLVHREVLQ